MRNPAPSARSHSIRGSRSPCLLLLVALLAAGCVSAPPGEAPEPVIVRPVVVAERGADELVKAIALLEGGNLRQAEANLEEIVKVRRDIPEAYFNLAWVKQRLDRHEEAIAAAEEGLKLQPAELRAYNLLAISQREAGRFADAEATYAKALALAPDSDKLHLNVGILYEIYLRKPQLALAHYRRYQSLRPVPDTKVAGWIAVIERQAAR